MTARHEIQNLVRRGNVFYWRPRIPRSFGRAAGRHLSLSLRQSDHMKARYMARRLNTMLHDPKLRPGAALTTKDQFEALFRTEVERMGKHLDNLQFAAENIDPWDYATSPFEAHKRAVLLRACGPRHFGRGWSSPADQRRRKRGIRA